MLSAQSRGPYMGRADTDLRRTLPVLSRTSKINKQKNIEKVFFWWRFFEDH
jgi:hypothetical protein